MCGERLLVLSSCVRRAFGYEIFCLVALLTPSMSHADQLHVCFACDLRGAVLRNRGLPQTLSFGGAGNGQLRPVSHSEKDA